MIRRASSGVVLALAGLPVLGAWAQPAPGLLREATQARIQSALDGVAAGSDVGTARQEIAGAFDAAIAYRDLKDPEPLTMAALELRLISLFENSAAGLAPGRLAILRANPALRDALAFLVSARDDAEGLLSLLERLNTERPETLRKFPQLSAAILVVHDARRTRPGLRPPDPAQPVPPPVVDPVFVLDHFATNAKKMAFDPAKLPAELAVFAVDLRVSPEDAAWALNKYGGDGQIGRHYDDVPYDTMYYERGVAKRISTVDYTLQNLLRVGGICTDQAYFVESIAQACGVPAVTVSGTRGEIGHAWVGYLQRQGGKARWDFDEGRYDEFDDVRASADDPQTGGSVTTADLALLAELTRVPPETRRRAEALCDAAARVAALAEMGSEGYPPPAPYAGAPAPTPASVEASLALYREAAALCPMLRDAWKGVAALAGAGRLEAGQRKAWAEAADRFLSQEYPDFAAEILASLIGGVADVQEQAGLWDWAAKRFVRRPDLAAEMVLAKGRMWQSAADKDKAYGEYVRVIDMYGNRTPLAVVALRAAEGLVSPEHPDRVVPLYAAAWKKIKKPSSASPQAWSATNWYQVGAAYAKKLAASGDKAQAEQVRRQLDPAGLRKK